MARLLKLFSINPTGLKLLFKAGLMTAALSGVYFLGVSFWSLLIFFLISFGIFLKEPPERRLAGISFFILTLLSVLSLALIRSAGPAPTFLIFGAFFVFFALFFILFGLINFFFKNRFAVYGVFNTVLLLLIFLIIQQLSLNDFLRYLLIFSAVALVFREAFVYFGALLGPRVWFASAVSGFLAVEFYFLVSFLPLGFINAAAFLTLSFLLVRDGLAVHFQGFLNLPFVFRQLTFFVFLAIIIFAAAKWAI